MVFSFRVPHVQDREVAYSLRLPRIQNREVAYSLGLHAKERSDAGYSLKRFTTLSEWALATWHQNLVSS